MKTALALCPQWDAYYPAYSLALLSATLKARGHETAIFDLNAEMFALDACGKGADFSPKMNVANHWTDSAYMEAHLIPSYREFLDSALERIVSSGARVVGFSVYFSNAVMSLHLARRLKRRDPSLTVVFGGPNCLTMKGSLSFLAHDAIDAVIYGEADRALPELVSALEKSGRLKAAPGVLLRSDPSTWIESQDPVEDLDTLPFADYEGHRLTLYGGKTIHSCRGCVRRCVFCSDWREMTYRQMSGERIFREIRHQLEKTPRLRSFLFGDSIINGSMKSMAAFCGLLTAESLNAEWGGFAIVRRELDLKFLTSMREAGCRWLTFGIESGSETVLRSIGKHVEISLNGRVLEDTVRAGIRTEATWLVGFPTETDESFEESLAFLRAHAAGIKTLGPSLFSIAEMGEYAAGMGFSTDHDLYWRGAAGNTFPKRVERLRRLIKEACAHGIDARFEGKFGPDRIDGCCATLLEGYRAWENRAAAP